MSLESLIRMLELIPVFKLMVCSNNSQLVSIEDRYGGESQVNYVSAVFYYRDTMIGTKSQD